MSLRLLAARILSFFHAVCVEVIAQCSPVDSLLFLSLFFYLFAFCTSSVQACCFPLVSAKVLTLIYASENGATAARLISLLCKFSLLRKIIMIEYNSALGCVLRHDLADLILLGSSEAVA